MSVTQFSPEVLRVGEAIPVALRDRAGMLLVPRGSMVASEAQRLQLAARELFVDEQDGEIMRRAMAGKLNTLLTQNALIGDLAAARPDASDFGSNAKPRAGRLQDPVTAWAILQTRLSTLLRDTTDAGFQDRLMRVQAGLVEMTDRDADDALMLLVQGAMTEVKDYSVRHAMLVAVVCDLAARHLPGWDDAWRPSLRCAALTMNIAMTQLQSMLVSQDSKLSTAQRATVDGHPVAGVGLLREAGVTDELWLGAVEHHHDSPPGPLAELPPALQLGRLIKRADIFAARLSPRKGRRPMSATAAAKAAYLDENQKPDEAGSAVIKATGLYPPGSLVRLRNGEVAVVVRRGRRANAPEVASLINAQGESIAISSLRNTQLHTFEVTGGVALHEVNIRLNIERLLKLV